jgi:hypothetical protein
MAFQKIEFEFSDDDNEKLEIEGSGAVEIDISGKKTKEDFTSPVGKKDKPASVVDSDEEDYEVEIVDDTPKADRNRKPSEPLMTLPMKNLKNILIKFANASSTLAKATMTNVALKRKHYGNVKSLNALLNSLLRKTKS